MSDDDWVSEVRRLCDLAARAGEPIDPMAAASPESVDDAGVNPTPAETARQPGPWIVAPRLIGGAE